MAEIEGGMLTSRVVFRKVMMKCPGCGHDVFGLYKCEVSIPDTVELVNTTQVSSSIAVQSVEMNHDCKALVPRINQTRAT